MEDREPAYPAYRMFLDDQNREGRSGRVLRWETWIPEDLTTNESLAHFLRRAAEDIERYPDGRP